MATKKWYAWTEIIYHTRDSDGKPLERRRVKCGTPVTQQQLHLNDQQWNALISSKSVRNIPYPVEGGVNPVSPAVHFKRLARMVEEGVDDPSLLSSVLPPLEQQEADPDVKKAVTAA